VGVEFVMRCLKSRRNLQNTVFNMKILPKMTHLLIYVVIFQVVLVENQLVLPQRQTSNCNIVKYYRADMLFSISSDTACGLGRAITRKLFNGFLVVL